MIITASASGNIQNPIVESITSNVALGAGSDIFDRTTAANLGKVTVNFVEYKYRKDKLTTTDYMNQIQDAVKGIPEVQLQLRKTGWGLRQVNL